MNIHHVHQQDENHFIKCSNPACDVTINRMRKYYLLRTKENKVMEMYEQAIKSHDKMKRRQSLDVSYLTIDTNYENFLNKFSLSPKTSPKNRRFSVPNKRKISDNKLNKSLGDLGPLTEACNDGNNQSNDTFAENPPFPHTTRLLPLDTATIDLNTNRRSMSMIDLSTNRHEHHNDLSTPARNLRPTASLNTRHTEARRRLDERKSLMNSLDTDIRKVDRLLSRMKVRSMPILAETSNLLEIDINIDEPPSTIRSLSSDS